jgi:hypothetical protein
VEHCIADQHRHRDQAPAIKPLATMRGQLSAYGAFNALTGFARQATTGDMVVMAPSLVIDFAKMEAARPGLFSGAASANGQVGLSWSTTSLPPPDGRWRQGNRYSSLAHRSRTCRCAR